VHIVVVDPSQQVPYYSRALTGALAERGDEVTLVTAPLLYYDIGPAAPGVHVVFAFGKLLGAAGAHARGGFRGDALVRHSTLRRLLRATGYPLELRSFMRWIADTRPAVVHLQWSLAPGLDAWLLGALRRQGIATVYTAHNVLPHEHRPWHAPLYRRLHRSAERVIVHSHAARERLIDLGGVDDDGIDDGRFDGDRIDDGRIDDLGAGDGARVRVIPMPADAAAPPPSRETARRALELSPEVPLALFFGHVRPYKGLDGLLAAWPAVAARLPGARLVIAGPVAGGDRAVRRIQADIDGLGIAGSVDLRPGYVAPAQVPALFAAADLVALPYRDTDDSAVLAAACGHGRAVVATAVGGLPEALAEGGGLMVPPEDPAALAEALVSVLSAPDRRDRLEAEMRAAAAAWTWRDAAEATQAVYAELVATRARDPA
jgi:glycosyltransferase involved in cell wall biosynthesis